MGFGVVDPIFGHSSGHRETSEVAAVLDRAAVRIACSRGAIDLALGEALARLFDQDGLIKLGYARRNDYARERLGIPPRTMYGWVGLARALEGRPLLRRAVRNHTITPRKALAVSQLAVGEDEPKWVAIASQLPFTELECAVRAGGGDPTTGYGGIENIILRMTPDQQYRFEEAITLAQQQTGYETSRWQCVEIICQEWLATYGHWQPEVPASLDASRGSTARHVVTRQVVTRQLNAIGLAEQPPGERETAVELDARIQRLLEGRRGFDSAFGIVAAQLVSGHVLPELGYQCLDQYCRERLGVSPRSFRERVWLERRMIALPPLRDALESGRLSYSKALLVAKDARRFDVEQRIEEATSTTWQQVERESTREEDRRNLAQGIRRIWAPDDAAGTITDAIVSAQAVAEGSGLGRIEAGEALAIIAAHFVAVWAEHRRRNPRARRHEVLLRHEGLCAVPGCSRPAQHEHHIRFRSQGGSDERWNLVGLCAVHHLRGVHHGNLHVTGRAGERLEWRLGSGEAFVTRGDDDVTVLSASPDRTAGRVSEPHPPPWPTPAVRADPGPARCVPRARDIMPERTSDKPPRATGRFVRLRRSSARTSRRRRTRRGSPGACA